MLRLTLILTLNQYEPILSRKRIMFVIGTWMMKDYSSLKYIYYI
jgi:hypothetical protein